MTDTFKCEMCREVFEPVRSNEEALAESRAMFGELPTQELALICDDCFKKMFKQIQ